MPDPSHICDLHHSSQQHLILNQLSEATTGSARGERWLVRIDGVVVHEEAQQ